MQTFKQFIKRHAPRSVRSGVQRLRGLLSPPASEDANLHAYTIVRDPSTAPRLSLVIPTIAPELAFGGILTGLDFFIDLGRRTGADLRLILDDFGPMPDTSVLYKRAQLLGVEAGTIEICFRRDQVPSIAVRSTDIFLTFNWWVTINIRTLVQQQTCLYAMEPRPYIYLIQDYEPQFYPFSSSHMMARLAFDGHAPYWGVFNTTELQRYCAAQGHSPARTFVFEPKISDSLRPFLGALEDRKEKRIFVYGRPNIPRNCFPAILRGLSNWIESDPDHTSWDIVSAGMPHPPIPLARGRSIRSVGKLSLDDYAGFLQGTAVGVSLMSSPHPSYPPLEMAHFGVLTITNRYANKDLGTAHENIISLGDIAPETLGRALKDACARFTVAPDAGSSARSFIPWFLREEPFECLDEIAALLRKEIWVPSAG